MNDSADKETAPVWYLPSQVFDGTKMLQDTAIAVADGCITKLVSKDQLIDPPLHLDGIVAPGFFDIQVNGGGDVLFNNQPTTHGAQAIAAAHRKFGTTHLLPTVITDTADIIDAACRAICDCAGRDGISGIHVEGPHISTVRSGTHNKSNIRPLDNLTIASLHRLREHNIPTLITLAPESVSRGQISTLVKHGVIVSLGHSDATGDEVSACLDEGAQLFTHLFNAMSQMSGRAPGMVGTAINSDAYCSIIADGKHVSAEMIQLAFNARPRNDRMILISDAMPTVGGKPEFDLYGETITVEDGSLINAAGSLAGAHITIAQSIGYLINHTRLSIEDCLKMAITHPASLMGTSELSQLKSMPVDQCIVISEDATQIELMEDKLKQLTDRQQNTI